MPNNPSSVMRTRRADFHTREAEGGGQVVEGYFVVFEQPYYVDDFFEEIVCRGAIDAATDTSDVRALIDHDSRLVLGRANDNVNTLSWSIDDTGVFATIQIIRLVSVSMKMMSSTWIFRTDAFSGGSATYQSCGSLAYVHSPHMSRPLSAPAPAVKRTSVGRGQGFKKKN